MKEIRINGHVLDGALIVDDPDAKQAYEDARGQLRHVRTFSQPGGLGSYVRKHPEGIIVAGAGGLFFTEPVPVSSAMIRFNESGSVDIHIKEDVDRIEKQLAVMDAMRAAAEDALR